MAKVFTDGNMRFSALCNEIVRIEIGEFLDLNTVNVPEREKFAGCEFVAKDTGGEYAFDFNGYTVIIEKGAKDLSTLRVIRGGVVVYSYKKIANCGELPPPHKTPEVFPLMDKPRIVPPKHGYGKESVALGEKFMIDKKSDDLYLIFAGGDFKRLRRLYIALTGAAELPTLSIMGLIFSKYYPYTQAEAEQKIEEFEKMGVPLDTLVVDTDWREISDLTFGCGYNVNKRLIPDIKGLFEFAHSHGVEVLMNDHPVPTKSKKSVFDGKEIAYREENLEKFLEMGLDIWWFDRNWMHLFNYADQPVTKELAGMYIYHDITKRHYQRKAKSDKVYKRPVILANISQIANGEYVKIRESASHRFAFQWSGDIKCDGDALRQEIANMIKCSNSMISYYSSDIGGHVSTPTRDDFIRWYQYGCFSPILRPHSTITSKKTREPWAYDEECFRITSAFVKTRYALLPELYSRAYDNYFNGLGVVSPVEFFYPDDKKTYNDSRSYMIGENIFVSPITSDFDRVYVGAENFVGEVSATFFGNKEMRGKPIYTATYDKIFFYHEGGERIEKAVPPFDYSAIFTGKMTFDEERDVYVESDDGVKVYIDGKLVAEDWCDHGMRETYLLRAEPRRVYDIKVEYYQAGNEAGLKFYTYKKTGKKATAYLPSGVWYNAYSGKKVVGGKRIKTACPQKDMPVFIKEGTLLTLSDEPKKAKKGLFDKLIAEFYPSRTREFWGYIYEDDGTTTAYREGEYLKYENRARYDEQGGRYVVELGAGEGRYTPKRKQKSVKFKMNILNGERVERVLVNGKEVAFYTHNRKKTVYPFIDGTYSPVFKTVTFKFKKAFDEKATIEIICKK